MIPYKQLSLADIFQDCQNKFNNDKPAFLSLLEPHIDIDEFIPISFRNYFYASTGRSRKYPLRAFLWALIIQRIFSIPTDQLLLTFLVYSKPLRDFCGFTKVPDASKITRFKQDFLDDLQLVFDKLVDITEPICQAVDSAKADMTITAALYPKLLTGNTFGDHKHFDKAYIPLNSRAGLEKQDYTINENGIPCCPHDDSLPMKYEGILKLRSGVTRYKFVCPKIKWIKNASTGRSQRHCTCDDPCTASSCGRMVYIYPEKDLRAYPGAIRGTEEWDNTYKIRTTVERDINHIKDNLCLAGRRIQNEKTLHADLILAGITQLITVVLSDKINHHEFIRSLKPLIA